MSTKSLVQQDGRDNHTHEGKPARAYNITQCRRHCLLAVGFFSLEKTMVSVLHKELEYNVEKLKYKKNGGHAAEDQNQIWISPHEVLQS